MAGRTNIWTAAGIAPKILSFAMAGINTLPPILDANNYLDGGMSMPLLSSRAHTFHHPTKVQLTNNNLPLVACLCKSTVMEFRK